MSSPLTKAEIDFFDIKKGQTNQSPDGEWEIRISRYESGADDDRLWVDRRIEIRRVKGDDAFAIEVKDPMGPFVWTTKPLCLAFNCVRLFPKKGVIAMFDAENFRFKTAVSPHYIKSATAESFQTHEGEELKPDDFFNEPLLKKKA